MYYGYLHGFYLLGFDPYAETKYFTLLRLKPRKTKVYIDLWLCISEREEE